MGRADRTLVSKPWRAGSPSVLLSLVVVLGACSLLGTRSDAARDHDRLLEQASSRYGAAGEQAVRDWQRMLNASRGLSERDKLTQVNLFFNSRLRFRDDIEIWGESDYWATPLETMVRQAGDCEDFSIAKYVSLLELGVPAQRLRLIYVKAERGLPGSGISQAHMVIGYFSTPTAEPLVLDNLVGDILPGSQRPDLTPVFSFNDAGLWAGGQLASADPTTRLSRWRTLLQRLHEDGFR